jgi:hypothetical protein
MGNFTPYLIVLAIVVFDVILYCGILAAAARMSGWTALAQKYRATKPFEGIRWHFQHAQMRWLTNYSGVLNIGANSDGLYLAPMLLFRFGHARLFIPWAETRIEMKKSFWSGKYMEICFPEMPGLVIRLTERLAQKIAATAGPELVSERRIEPEE